MLAVVTTFQSTGFALEDYREMNKIDYMDRVFYFDMGEFLEGYEQEEKVDEYAYYVKLLENLGVYTTEDTKRSSDAKMKKSEVYKIIMNVILKTGENSYAAKDMENDGYLSMFDVLTEMCGLLGYEKIMDKIDVEKVADDSDLLDGVSYSKDKTVSFGEFSVILWNTLNAYGMEVNFSGGDIIYDEAENSFLERYMDINKTVGYLNAANGLNIYKNSAPTDGCVEIDRAKFLKDGDMREFLGHRVVAYSKKNNKDENEILHIDFDVTDDNVVIDFEDIVSVDSYIKYYDGGKSYKNIKISDIDYVMFNGDANCDLSVLDNYKNMDGYVTLSKSEDSSLYDVAVINSYEYFVVYSVDEKERRIYLKNNMTFMEKDYIELPDDEFVECILDENIAIFTDFFAGNTIRVLQNPEKTYTEVVGVSKTVTGKVTDYDPDGDIATINGKEYKTSKSYLNRNSIKVETGLYGTFYMSADGYIVDYKAVSDTHYGFITRAIFDEESEKAYIEVFTQDNEWKNLELKPKITIDGIEGVLAEEAVRNIRNNNALNALIRYKANGNDFVTYIDTIYDDVRERNDSSRLVQSYAGTVTMSWMGGRWFRSDMGYRILNDKPVFEIPGNLNKKDNFKVIASSNLNKDESQIYITMYSANSLGLCEVAMISEQADDVQTDTTYWFYCEKISFQWDNEQDLGVYVMEGKRIRNGGDGAVVDFTIKVTEDKKESVELTTPNGIAPGALMRVTYNSDQYLTGADIKFVNATLPEIKADVISSYFQHLSGTVGEIDVENEFIQVVCGTAASDKFVMNVNSIIAIDKTTKKARKIKLGDLRKGEKIFVFRSAGIARIGAVVR